MRRGNGEGEDGAKVMVSLSSLLGRVRVRTARVRVTRDEGGEDGARARVRVQIVQISDLHRIGTMVR